MGVMMWKNLWVKGANNELPLDFIFLILYIYTTKGTYIPNFKYLGLTRTK